MQLSVIHKMLTNFIYGNAKVDEQRKIFSKNSSLAVGSHVQLYVSTCMFFIRSFPNFCDTARLQPLPVLPILAPDWLRGGHVTRVLASDWWRGPAAAAICGHGSGSEVRRSVLVGSCP